MKWGVLPTAQQGVWNQAHNSALMKVPCNTSCCYANMLFAMLYWKVGDETARIVLERKVRTKFEHSRSSIVAPYQSVWEMAWCRLSTGFVCSIVYESKSKGHFGSEVSEMFIHSVMPQDETLSGPNCIQLAQCTSWVGLLLFQLSPPLPSTQSVVLRETFIRDHKLLETGSVDALISCSFLCMHFQTRQMLLNHSR